MVEGRVKFSSTQSSTGFHKQREPIFVAHVGHQSNFVMLIDRILALIFLVLLSPFWLLGCVWVYLEDGGPIFFQQKRVGENDKEFTMFKIRSMKKDTPQVSSNDLQNPEQYVLHSGKWLRKFSIDELPNLINIIKGEMIFIGPRPLVRSEVKLHDLRSKYGILEQKPGLTGFAQVNGRDLVTIEEKVKLELYYKRNKSLFLRIMIIAKSVIIVLRSAGVRF